MKRIVKGYKVVDVPERLVPHVLGRYAGFAG